MSDHLKIPCVKIAQILVAPSSTSFWAACTQCLSIAKGKIGVHNFLQYLLSDWQGQDKDRNQGRHQRAETKMVVLLILVLIFPSQLTPRPRPHSETTITSDNAACVGCRQQGWEDQDQDQIFQTKLRNLNNSAACVRHVVDQDGHLPPCISNQHHACHLGSNIFQ